MTGILSLTTFLPLLGVAAILLLRRSARPSDRPGSTAPPRWIALATTLATLALVDPAGRPVRPAPSRASSSSRTSPGSPASSYRMGVDGISVLFVLLTAFLMPLCIVASWKSIKKRVLEYMIAFLVLETLVIGVFCALDLILFYIFFEGSWSRCS